MDSLLSGPFPSQLLRCIQKQSQPITFLLTYIVTFITNLPFYVWFRKSCQKSCKTSLINMPTFQMNKQRLRDRKQLDQDPTASGKSGFLKPFVTVKDRILSRSSSWSSCYLRLKSGPRPSPEKEGSSSLSRLPHLLLSLQLCCRSKTLCPEKNLKVTPLPSQLQYFHKWALVSKRARFIFPPVCVCSVAQSRPAPCSCVDCSPPGSSVRGILQPRILERVAISYSRGSSQPRHQTHISRIFCVGRQILYH